MAHTEDLTGNRYGRLTVIERADSGKHGEVRWLCKCDCGGTSKTRPSLLRSGRAMSCGCLHREMVSKKFTTHGQTNTRLYKIWEDMKLRCYNQRYDKYHCYGGRGIFICDEWKNSFVAFRDWAENNGYADNLTIDRVNVNGCYEPSNCTWKTIQEQQLNTRRNRRLTLDGETKTLKEWSDQIGIKYVTLQARLRYGWSDERALREAVTR